ncbi:MAG: hypothetical protein RMY28_037230 [Nostoc sp. ChiSLP01]|nr:hypothetical protein [Nostoc sp. CmiSLP01]MDZ8287381.1 hypothetical protein [Nostoc sp. ChiSLP01]
MLSIPRYALSKQFYDGSTTIVYGALPETNSLSVVVKLVKNLHRDLFTIETVGKATRLGLAIARQIILEKYNNLLQCNSSPGQSVEFAILISVQH